MTKRSHGVGQLSGMARPTVVLLASAVGGLAAAAIADVGLITALLVSLLIAVIVVAAGSRLSVVRGSETRRLAVPGNLAEAPSAGSQATPCQGQDYGAEHSPRQTEGSSASPVDQHGPDGALLLMQQYPPSDGSAPWWQMRPAKPRPTAEIRAAPPPLSSYLDSALIAQCPRCGWFGVDAQQGEAEWAFRCQACVYGWTWRPGTAWPLVEVRPRLRGGRRPAPLDRPGITRERSDPAPPSDGGI